MWFFSLVVYCTDETMKAQTRIHVKKKLLRWPLCFQPIKKIKISDNQVKSVSTPAIFDYLLQHKNIQQRLYV